MRKYKEYHFTTAYEKVTGRNGKIEKVYRWSIRNANGEVLESSKETYDTTQDAEHAAQEYIDEMHY